jgi:ion channel
MTGDDQPTTGSDGQPAAESSGEQTATERPARLPTARAPRLKPHQIRRVPKPRMTGLLDSPIRNLGVGVAYTVTVMIVATAAYMAAGWSFRDALYMVIVTVYTVGYNEVRPINTPALNAITIGLIVLG